MIVDAVDVYSREKMVIFRLTLIKKKKLNIRLEFFKASIIYYLLWIWTNPNRSICISDLNFCFMMSASGSELISCFAERASQKELPAEFF